MSSTYPPQAAPVFGAVYDLVTADATIAAAVAAGRLRTFYGEPYADRAAPIQLSVGSNGNEDSPLIEATWEWDTSGGPTVAEIAEWIDVPCGVWGLDGGSVNLRAITEETFAIFAAAATALRGAVLPLGPVMWSTMGGYTVAPMQTQSGAEVAILFTVRVRTQI